MQKVDCKFWHPTKGGWYYATLIRKGYKWVIVLDITGTRKRLAVADVKAVD